MAKASDEGRVTPRFHSTMAEADVQFLDQIDRVVGSARQAEGLSARIGRAGVLRGIIDGVRRLGLNFSKASTPEDIADLIAGPKKRRTPAARRR